MCRSPISTNPGPLLEIKIEHFQEVQFTGRGKSGTEIAKDMLFSCGQLQTHIELLPMNSLAWDWDRVFRLELDLSKREDLTSHVTAPHREHCLGSLGRVLARCRGDGVRVG